MGMLKLFLLPLLVVDSWWSSSPSISFVTGFSVGGDRTTRFCRHRQLVLFAEGGAPQYQKQKGILQRSECVGEGSYLLHIDYDKNNGNDGEDSVEDGYYQAGHVLALEIQPPDDTTTTDAISDTENGTDSLPSSSSSSFTTVNEKTKRDLDKNDGWLRGPYTVSRGYGSSNSNNEDDNDDDHNAGFQVLIKEVGYKSHVFATSTPGTPVRFGGRFKVPIVEGIQTAASNNSDDDDDDDDSDESDTATKRVVMISTGSGVGPCIGAIESLLLSPDNDIDIDNNVAIDLIASFRTRDEITMATDLDRLQSNAHSLGKKFNWKAVITGEVGRLSSNKPDILREYYLQHTSDDDSDNLCMIRNTHYHLIGNGQLVNEWTKGLKKAGVPTKRVTTEAYFNHAAEPDATAINNIYEAILLDNDNDTERNNQVVGSATATSS